MRAATLDWLRQAAAFEHIFQQRWLGERFFHIPGDLSALQDIIWRVKPRLIVATGIAAGGGPIFLASMLELAGSDGIVAAIDPKLRDDVRARLDAHPSARRLRVFKDSPFEPRLVEEITSLARERAPVMLVCDLDHTHPHVRRELDTFAPLVTPGSYAVVLDTIMEDLPDGTFAGKPYGKGNNPGTAARAFVAEHPEFRADLDVEDRVLMTLAPGGFLLRASG
jgi:cephalosporin hydroxylase